MTKEEQINTMKPPPFLLGAGLLFWGWQTDLLAAGALMAIVLEGSRFSTTRWDFSYDDFRRLWSFSTVLFLAALVYAFTANEGPAGFQSFFQNPNFHTQRGAGAASAKTVTSWLRWLPMVFFLFMAAQAFSSRQAVPLAGMSLIMRRRLRRLQKQQRTPGPEEVLAEQRYVSVSYPYFGLCLFAASIHPSETHGFFWGLCALLAWALWSHRSRRFHVATWAGALAMAMGIGYFAQGSLGHLQRYLEGINPQWLSNLTRRGFDHDKTTTSIGQIGRIKTSGKIVIRLEPKPGSSPPSLLREAAYRSFKGLSWNSDIGEKDFDNVLSETNVTSWPLLPGKINTSAVSIAAYLPGGRALLPLPEGSGRLEQLAAYTLKQNSLGSVLAEGPGLVVFDALYGPGATIDSPFATNDLTVFYKETNALDQVISDLHLKGQTAEQAMRTLNGFFQSNFTYSMWQPFHRPRDTDETAIGRFLLLRRSGHCEYFATATTLLLRRAGIPARYAVGYAVHEASGRKYVVRQHDAHAWCLVWNEKKDAWQDFDTTPASWLEAEGMQASRFQALSDAWSRIAFEFSRLRWAQTHVRQYLLWSLIPILALLLYQIIFRSRRRHKLGAHDFDAAIAWPGLDSEFYQLEKKLVEHGAAREPGEPLSIWLNRAAIVPELVNLKTPLDHLLNLHYRYRFDPNGLSHEDRSALKRETSACLEKLESM
jgi:hypothetical protein